jgi:glutaminyl-peptide cyclotransferase
MKQYKQYLITGGLLLLAACNNNKPAAPVSSTQSDVPAVISYQLVNIYPHDTAAFTEGLQFVNGYLYESSGEYGTSDIRKVDLVTGKVLQRQQMEARYFGEGLTVLHDKIYQLTYREKTGFIYDLNTLKQQKTFSYNGAEGWGMTNDGTYLIYDDGSNVLYYVDPNTMQQVKTLSVTDEQGPVQNINELEYIKGFIYANQWQTDNILKINPATGKVVARADLGDLRQKVGMPPMGNVPGSPDVLNGIAYDAVTNRIFVTGKYWPKLMEIKLDN